MPEIIQRVECRPEMLSELADSYDQVGKNPVDFSMRKRNQIQDVRRNLTTLFNGMYE